MSKCNHHFAKAFPDNCPVCAEIAATRPSRDEQAVGERLIIRMAKAIHAAAGCPFPWGDIPDVDEAYIRHAQAALTAAQMELLDGADALRQATPAPDEGLRELLREAGSELEAGFDQADCTCTFPEADCCFHSRAKALHARIDAALSETPHEPADQSVERTTSSSQAGAG